MYVLDTNDRYERHLGNEGITTDNRARLRSRQPALMTFTYRQSPGYLLRINPAAVGGWMVDPPGNRPGMIQVDLDPVGRLIHLTANPWQTAPPVSSTEPNWDLLLEAAGLEPAALEETQSVWNPPVFADSQKAWLGNYPEGEQVPIRIEAAGLAGLVTWFRIIEPWVEPVSAEVEDTLEIGGTPVVFMVRFLVVLLLGAVLAWRNLRLGRGDRQGAFRTALLFGAVRVTWLLAADHIPTGQEIEIITAHVAYSAYRVCLVWVFYIALEPYARRLWPQMLTSWFRLLKGQLRDPLVGRDVLVGIAVAAGSFWIAAGQILATSMLDRPIPPPLITRWSIIALRGGRHVFGAIGGELENSIWSLFMVVMMFLLFKLLVRKTWIAVTVQTILMIGVFMDPSDPISSVLGSLAFIALLWWLLFRFGLLAVLVFFTISDLLAELPLTLDFSAWYAGSTWVTILVIAGLTGWSFYVSLAGRPVFKDDLLSSGAMEQ